MPEELDGFQVGRIMPHSEESERSVIGSMLMDADAIGIASEYITGEDFYNRSYGVIFDTIVEMDEARTPVDPVTLVEKLRQKDLPPDVASIDTMRAFLGTEYTSQNVTAYAKKVAEKSTLRKLIKANASIQDTCFKAEAPMEDILNDAEKQIFDIVQKRNTSEIVPIRTIVKEAIAKIDSAYTNKGPVTGLATGFYDLDRDTSGFQRSDLILLAARPSMGKTAFALNIAEHMALKLGLHVAIFSLEMSKEQLVNRLFAVRSKVDAEKLRNGRLTPEEWRKLTESASEIGMSNLIIDDTPGISVPEMRSKCRKLQMTQGLDVIFIDYLQLMTGSGKADSRQQEISNISRSLKALARELKVPVVALSQLSRQVEQRPDKRPMLSDLRESGAIEQDADVVMFIYREDYYKKDTDRKNIADIIIAKQRNGPIGTTSLAWIPELTLFRNLDREVGKKNQE